MYSGRSRFPGARCPRDPLLVPRPTQEKYARVGKPRTTNVCFTWSASGRRDERVSIRDYFQTSECYESCAPGTDWKGTHRFLDQNLPQSTATPSASFHAVKTRRAILSPITIDSQDVEAGSPRQSPELFPVQQPLCDNKGEKEKRRSGDANGHKPPLLAVEWRGRQDGDGAGSNGRSTLKHRARCPRRWLGC